MHNIFLLYRGSAHAPRKIWKVNGLRIACEPIFVRLLSINFAINRVFNCLKGILDCFIRVFDCSIREYRSFWYR